MGGGPLCSTISCPHASAVPETRQSCCPHYPALSSPGPLTRLLWSSRRFPVHALHHHAPLFTSAQRRSLLFRHPSPSVPKRCCFWRRFAGADALRPPPKPPL